MASKITAMETMAAFGQEVFVEISDARVINSQLEGGKIEIALTGVKLAEVDWQAVGEVFKQAGISQDDADFLLNSFANQTELHLMAKFLAARMRRVG